MTEQFKKHLDVLSQNEKLDLEVKNIEENGAPFVLHLPFDEQAGLRGRRAERRVAGAWDVPLGQWLKEKSTKSARLGRSPLALSQSGAEFYETIDMALSEGGIYVAEALKRTRWLEKGGMTMNERATFNKRLGPVYRKLREMGYSEKDLS